MKGHVVQIPTCSVGKLNANKNSLNKHDTQGVSISSSLRKQTQKTVTYTGFISHYVPFYCHPINHSSPYVCASVCVHLSLHFVRLSVYVIPPQSHHLTNRAIHIRCVKGRIIHKSKLLRTLVHRSNHSQWKRNKKFN